MLLKVPVVAVIENTPVAGAHKVLWYGFVVPSSEPKQSRNH